MSDGVSEDGTIRFSWEIVTDDPDRPCSCYAFEGSPHPEIEHFDCADLFQIIRCGVCHGCNEREYLKEAYKWASCPWYRSRGLKDRERLPCTYGCSDEPICETNEPTGGWLRDEK